MLRRLANPAGRSRTTIRIMTRSQALDRSSAILGALLPRGWFVLGLLGPAAMLEDARDAKFTEITFGGGEGSREGKYRPGAGPARGGKK